MTTETDTLTAIAAELYANPPKEFITVRDARAKSLADPATAAEVKAWRKPLLAAWVVNLLAHERADELGQVFQLAGELREAQDDLDAPTLSRLGRERRALIRELAKQAGDLAAERGERISPSTLEAVQQTLNAAMLDAAAAAAVASGRLTRPLDPSELDGADLSDAVAGPIDTAEPTASMPADELQSRRERRDAERAAREAEKQAVDAEREQFEVESRLSTFRDREESLAERAQSLEDELQRVQDDLKRLRREIEEVAPKQADAAKKAAAARRAADRARAKTES